jgi:glutathione S-transferase
MSDTAIVLHGTPLSGHTHRVGLMLDALGLAWRFVPAPKDVRASPAFLALNPLGQIPVLRDGDLVLADSNAGEIMHGPCAARMIALFDFPDDPARAASIAARILTFMDGHLAGRRFLAADNVTIADLACYSYVAHAPDGGVALEPYPAVRAWLARVEAQPWFRPMPDFAEVA